MKPTSVRMLLLVAGLSGLAGWFWADLIDKNGRLPSVPWMAVLVVWVVAALLPEIGSPMPDATQAEMA